MAWMKAFSLQSLLFSMALTRFSAFFSPKRSRPHSCAFVRAYSWSASCKSPASTSWAAVFSEKVSMSMASRLAKWLSRITIWGLQPSRLGQNRCAPRSSSAAPQAGQTSGLTMSRSPSLYSSTRPMISGMTSLERRIHTFAPSFTRLRWMSCQLFSVACRTVAPASSTGETRATGVSLPVRPICQVTSSSTVVISSASNL